MRLPSLFIVPLLPKLCHSRAQIRRETSPHPRILCDASPPLTPDQPANTVNLQLQQPSSSTPPQFAPAVKVRRLSLPTHRERLYLQTLRLTRPRSRPRQTRTPHLCLSAWPLVPRAAIDPTVSHLPYHYPPPWAYTVHIRAAKSVHGKRAVPRTVAKRRLRAAAALVLPAHARRGWEYVFAASPSVCDAPFHHLVDDIRVSLKAIGAWRDHLPEDAVVRPKYSRIR